MSVQYNTTISVSSNGPGSLSGTFVDVGNNDLTINFASPAGAAGVATGITFNGANLQSIELIASQNMTLQVNSTGSPFTTINLKANIPYQWSNSASYFANPLNTSVTNIYVTNTPAATLKGKVLTN